MNATTALVVLVTAPCAWGCYHIARAWRDSSEHNRELGGTIVLWEEEMRRKRQLTLIGAVLALAWIVLLAMAVSYAAAHEVLVVMQHLKCETRPYHCSIPPWFCGTDGEGRKAKPIDDSDKGRTEAKAKRPSTWDMLPIMTRLRYVVTPSSKEVECLDWQRDLQQTTWPNVYDVWVAPLVRVGTKLVTTLADDGGHALSVLLSHFTFYTLLQAAVLMYVTAHCLWLYGGPFLRGVKERVHMAPPPPFLLRHNDIAAASSLHPLHWLEAQQPRLMIAEDMMTPWADGKDVSL